MRFDLLGIREFAEIMTRSGGLSSGSFPPSPAKAIEGAKLHRHIQKKLARDHDGFVSEKSVVYTFEPDSFTEPYGAEAGRDGVDLFDPFMLEGRTDGYYEEKDVLPGADGTASGDNAFVPVIVEIKSAETLPPEAVFTHYVQGAVYGYILTANMPAEQRVRIRIIYGTYSDFDATEDFFFDKTCAELRSEFAGIAFRYSRFVRYMNSHAGKIGRELASLPFLFDEFRPGQRMMSVNVYNALSGGTVPAIMCQAPTGIGKTAAVLYPALKALRSDPGSHPAVFYLTARNEGSRPPCAALDAVSAKAPELRYINLTSKEKICMMNRPGAIDGPETQRYKSCDPAVCPYAVNHYEGADKALGRIIGSEIRKFDVETVRSLSEEYACCPYELELDISGLCDVIVCDYNYLFDPESYLRRYFDSKKGRYFFLIDEAHQLPDRVRSMYSASLSANRFERLSAGRKRSGPGRLFVQLAEAIRDTGGVGAAENGVVSVAALSDSFEKLIERVCDRCAEYLEKKSDEQVLEAFFDLRHFRKMNELSRNGRYAKYVVTGSDDVITLAMADPSAIIGEKCGIALGTVFFSGTLIPEDYFKKQLGTEDIPYVGFPSPFPPENLMVIADTGVDTRYRYRENSYGCIAELIEKLGMALGTGNYIVFFSSYAYMNAVIERMSGDFSDNYIFVQPRTSDRESRDRFISGFAGDTDRLHIGFCVLGGSYSEGVDLPGDRLSGVIIIGTGVPQVNTATEMIRNYYENNGGGGYENAYFYPGINKIAQAAGRVIRTPSDKGFVLLVDRRFAFRDHRSALPPDWNYAAETDGEKIISAIVDFMS